MQGGLITNRKIHTALNNPLSLNPGRRGSSSFRKGGRWNTAEWLTKIKLLAISLLLSGIFVVYIRSTYSNAIEDLTDLPLWFSEDDTLSQKQTISALLRSNLSMATQKNDVMFFKNVLLGYKTFYRSIDRSDTNSNSASDRSRQQKIVYQVPYIPNSLSLSFGKTKRKDAVSTALLGKSLVIFTATTVEEHSPLINDIMESLIGVSGSLSYGPFVFRRMSPMKLLKIRKDNLRDFEIVMSTQKISGNLYDGHIFHYYVNEEGDAINPVLYAGHQVRFDYDHTGFTIPMIAPHIVEASIDVIETAEEVPLSNDNFVSLTSKTVIISFSVFLQDPAYGRLGKATYYLIVKENEHGIRVKIEISAFDGVTLGRVEASFSMDAMSSISPDRFYNTFYYYGNNFKGLVKHGHLDLEEYENRMMQRSSVPNLEKDDYFLYDKQTQFKPIDWFAICQDGSSLVSPCILTQTKNFTSTTLPELSGTSPFNEVRHSSGGKKGGFNWIETWYNVSTLSSNFEETNCKKGVAIIEERRIPVSGFLHGDEQFLASYETLLSKISTSNVDISISPEFGAITHGIASIYTGVCIKGLLSSSSYETICGDSVKNWIDSALRISLLIAEQSHDIVLNEQLKTTPKLSVEHLAYSIMASYKMAKYFPLNETYLAYSAKCLELLLSYQISANQDRRYGVFVCGYDPLKGSARQTVSIDCHTIATVALMKGFELFLSVEEQTSFVPEGIEGRIRNYTIAIVNALKAYQWQSVDGVNLLYINQGIAKKDVAESTTSAALILELTLSLEKLLTQSNSYFQSLLDYNVSKLHKVATKLKRYDVVTTNPGGDVIEAESFILSHHALANLIVDITRKGTPSL